MSGSRGIGPGFTRVFACVIVALGVAMIVRTVAAGGEPLSFGIIIGVLFVAIGLGRLYLSVRTSG